MKQYPEIQGPNKAPREHCIAFYKKNSLKCGEKIIDQDDLIYIFSKKDNILCDIWVKRRNC